MWLRCRQPNPRQIATIPAPAPQGQRVQRLVCSQTYLDGLARYCLQTCGTPTEIVKPFLLQAFFPIGQLAVDY